MGRLDVEEEETMVFPLSNSGFNPVASGVEPMGEMILPAPGSGVDPFGFTNPQVSLAAEPGLGRMGWGGSSVAPAPGAMNSMSLPMPAVAPYGAPGAQGYCAPPSGGPNSSLAQASALLDFVKGIFSGLMFSKLAHQWFPGSGAESEQTEPPEVTEESSSSASAHANSNGQGKSGHPQAA